MGKLTDIKGIGEKRLEQLRNMGIETPAQLLRVYPRRYLDFNTSNRVEEAEDGGLCLFRCRLAANPISRISKKGLRYVQAELRGGGGKISAVWFNNRFVADGLKEDAEYIFWGRVQVDSGVTLMNPQYRQITEDTSFNRLQPVYPLPPELAQSKFSEFVSAALKMRPAASVIPEEVAKREGLMDINAAYFGLHCPRDYADVGAASSRLALEEILQLMIALKQVRAENVLRRERRYPNLDYDPFLRVLPFALTEGQRGAAERIVRCLSADTVMNLLVQGDVGSGKTAVAFLAMYLAAANGYQCALMAPTEVLAKQHYEKAARIFGQLGFQTELLIGSMPAQEKRRALERVECGLAKVVVGTHAVIQGGVRYRDLGLVVTDEQHRFGVRQRRNLADKGGDVPADVLVMSATPIPRTLSLVMYGDMDVATIAAKPKGRKPIKTSIVPERRHADMLQYIGGELRQGRQAYVICPKISESGDERDEKASVEKVLREYRGGAFAGLPVAALHGGMTQEAKDAVMREFAANRVSLLVATTVVEVGVDVPNASIMVIYDADRFGLSQLHQLRGRVGRGEAQSYCFLLTRTQSEDAMERLRVLVSTADGFEIANKDFELRGGGELLGDRQSGFDCSVLRRVKLDGKVVERARRIFDELTFDEDYRRFFLASCAREYRNLLAVTI